MKTNAAQYDKDIMEAVEGGAQYFGESNHKVRFYT